MTVETYINILLVGVPTVLLMTHWREAWDFLDGAFSKMASEPAEMPLFPTIDERGDADESRKAA